MFSFSIVSQRLLSIHAEAGIQNLFKTLDSRSTDCGNDITAIYKQMRFLQKSEKSPSVILSLSKNDGKSNSYITLRQAQGDNLGLLQEP